MTTTTPSGPFLYTCFDLCLSLPFTTRLLAPVPSDMPIDVTVSMGSTPPTLPNPHSVGESESMQAYVEIDRQGDMLWTTAKARYWATQGNQIVIEPLDEPKLGAIQHFVLFYCLPAILNQRGLMAMHASAVVGPQGAIIVAGNSGAGKSTLLAALLSQGFSMLADDVTVVRPRLDGHTFDLLPGYPLYRLCADTLEQITPVAERVVALGGPRNKYAVHVSRSTIHADAVPLHAIYALAIYEGDRLEVTRAEGMSAFQFVQRNCYGPMSSLTLPSHFQFLYQVVQHVPVYQIQRPAKRWTLDELVQIIAAP